MTRVRATPKRIGGSFCVFIPAEVAKNVGLREDRPVELEIRTVREPVGTLLGMYPDLPPFDKSKARLWNDR